MDYDYRDSIHLRDLSLSTIIGIKPDERQRKQKLLLNLCLYSNQKKAAESDDFSLTVDYEAVEARVKNFVETSSFQLIETMAQNIAHQLLQIEGVSACRVLVDKPEALRFTRSAAVEIFRERIKE